MVEIEVTPKVPPGETQATACDDATEDAESGAGYDPAGDSGHGAISDSSGKTGSGDRSDPAGDPGRDGYEYIEVQDDTALYRRTWRNWIFLAAILLIVTIGLCTSNPSLVGKRIVSPWPWLKTDLILVVGLSLMSLMFVAYMTQQQRQVLGMHRKMRRLQREAEKRMQQHNTHLFTLTNLGRKMATEINLQTIFDFITEMCIEVFECSRASLMLHEKETGELVVRSISGTSRGDIIDTHQKVGEGIAGWAAARGEALLLGAPMTERNIPIWISTTRQSHRRWSCRS